LDGSVLGAGSEAVAAETANALVNIDVPRNLIQHQRSRIFDNPTRNVYLVCPC
jgi:hypothetical protein